MERLSMSLNAEPGAAGPVQPALPNAEAGIAKGPEVTQVMPDTSGEDANAIINENFAEDIADAKGVPPNFDAGFVAAAKGDPSSDEVIVVPPPTTEPAPKPEAEASLPTVAEPGDAGTESASEPDTEAAEPTEDVLAGEEVDAAKKALAEEHREPEPVFGYVKEAQKAIDEAIASGTMSAADRKYLGDKLEEAKGEEARLYTNLVVTEAREALAAAKPNTPEHQAASQKLSQAIADRKEVYEKYFEHAKAVGKHSSPQKTDMDIISDWSKEVKKQIVKAQGALTEATANNRPVDINNLTLRIQALQEHDNLLESKKRRGALKSILSIVTVAIATSTLGNMWKQARGGAQQAQSQQRSH